MLIPLGILARESSMRMIPAPRRLAPILAGALALLIALIVLVPTMRATIEANLGTLAQTRAELSVYEWPRYSFQDQLRRNGIVDLKPAVAHYQNALALDSTNATANRRLGQIELSLGHYDAAHRYLDAAYASAPQHIATRILLGELYALDNQPNQAVALWQNLEMNFNSLQTRLWWYEFIGDQDRLQKLRQATQKAKN
jgi:tetratricopeptide (TPR) repeat protein